MVIRYLIIFLVLNTSCSGFKHLDKAQDKFSKAASLEMNSNPTSPEWPSVYYSVAYAHAQKSLKYQANLKKYGLQSTALTLKALCEWKLSKYDLAQQPSKKALALMTVPSRDKTLMKALPGLILIEKTNDRRRILFEKNNPNLETIQEFFTNNLPNNLGFDILEAAKNESDNDQNLLIYLNQAGFTGLKVWSDSLDNLKQIMDLGTHNLDILFTQQYEFYLQQKEKLFLELKNIDQDDSRAGYWNKILL